MRCFCVARFLALGVWWERLTRSSVSTKCSSLPYVLLGCLVLAAPCKADEIDDILSVRARNQEKVKKFSAEVSVETQQPKGLQNPKKLNLRYRMKLEKLPEQARAKSHNPWLMETEVLEPIPMKMKVEGDQAWYMDQHGEWVELVLTPELREQFFGMSERFMGADPAEQRKRFDMKVVRRNKPIFGPRTKTLEFKPKGQARMFERMEEDVNSDGLALATRLYDSAGKKTLEVQVKRHGRYEGVPIAEVMESVSDTAAGEVVSTTTCSVANLEEGE